MASTGIIDLVVWLIVIEVLAFATLPWIAWMLPSVPDRGYGISKIVGVIAFGFLSWVFPALGIVSATSGYVTVVFSILAIAGYLLWQAELVPVATLRELLRTYALSVEGVFLGLTLLFAFIRVLNPEIFWGEKPMDSTFLHFFTRNETLPPQDPWASGNQMRYYYVGVYLIACLLKLTAIPVSVGYNLAIATLAGFIGATFFSLLQLLTKSRLFSTITALLLVTATDPEVFKLTLYDQFIPAFKTFWASTRVFTSPSFFEYTSWFPLFADLHARCNQHISTFDTFWASTRVFTSPSFFEYTSWSLLFADLHAHVIAIPVTALLLFCSLACYLAPSDRYSLHGLTLRVMIGAAWGLLYGMNTWDFITFGTMTGLLVLATSRTRFWTPPRRADRTVATGEALFADGFPLLVGLLWDGIPIFIGAFLVALPYAVTSGAGAGDAVSWGYVTGPEFNTLGQLWRTQGYGFALVLLASIVLFLFQGGQRKQWKAGNRLMLVSILSVFALAIVASLLHGVRNLPWGILTSMVLIAVWSWFSLCRGGESREVKAAGGMIIYATFLIVILELFFLMDRMNTMFKGYMAVWMLFSAACATLTYYAWIAVNKRHKKVIALIFGSAVMIVAFCSLLGFLLNSFAIAKLQRVPERFYTLDGLEYLKASQADDYHAIGWLNDNLTGTPVILEAQGGSYREFTRISMHTGLPTILGWEHHVSQRGLPYDSLLERKQAIRIIYSSPDIAAVKRELIRYNVQFIVVGDVERSMYSDAALAKFQRFPELFTPVFSSGHTTIYVTYFSKFHPNYKRLLHG